MSYRVSGWAAAASFIAVIILIAMCFMTPPLSRDDCWTVRNIECR